MERNHTAYSDRLMFCVYRYIYIDVTTLFRKLFERGDPMPFLSFESTPPPIKISVNISADTSVLYIFVQNIILSVNQISLIKKGPLFSLN